VREELRIKRDQKNSEFCLVNLVPDIIQTSKTDILYSNMMKYEVIKKKLPSKHQPIHTKYLTFLDVPTCCYWNKQNKKFYFGDVTGDVNVIELYKNGITSIKKSNHDKKKIKGIYCSSEEKLWFCDVDRLYFKHGSKDKVFNLERIEKIYSKTSIPFIG
jgi:hypothetical protein